MNVPFVALNRRNEALKASFDTAFRRVMDRGNFILGDELTAFESEFAAYCGASQCVGVGNGLDALTLILRAYGFGPGDEVIVPAHTFIATWLAVSAVGAQVVGVDVDPRTYNIDINLLGAAVTPRTRAIIVVHLYGQPAAMDELREFANARGLRLIEDAAQAHGATYKQRKAGALADAAAFSFYPTKNLGAMGDGGAVVTADEALASRIRLLRNYGSAKKYEHERQGVNSRLDELQAAFLRVALSHLDDWNERRRAHAARYLHKLEIDETNKPFVATDCEPVWHLFVIRHSAREHLAKSLAQAGVATMIHFPKAPARHDAYSSLAEPARCFAAADALCAEVLSLPLDPYLTEAEVDYVAEAVSRLA